MSERRAASRKKKRKVVSSDEEKEEIKRHFRAFGKRRVGGKKVRPRRISPDVPPRRVLRGRKRGGGEKRKSSSGKGGNPAPPSVRASVHHPSSIVRPTVHSSSSSRLSQSSSASRWGRRPQQPRRCVGACFEPDKSSLLPPLWRWRRLLLCTHRVLSVQTETLEDGPIPSPHLKCVCRW